MPTDPQREALIARLGKASVCVYLACEEPVADDLSDMLREAIAALRASAPPEGGQGAVTASEVLQHIEWSGSQDAYECPWCREGRTLGHKVDCPVAAALRHAAPAVTPEGKQGAADLIERLENAYRLTASSLFREAADALRASAPPEGTDDVLRGRELIQEGLRLLLDTIQRHRLSAAPPEGEQTEPVVLKRRMDTPEARAYWAGVDALAAERTAEGGQGAELIANNLAKWINETTLPPTEIHPVYAGWALLCWFIEESVRRAAHAVGEMPTYNHTRGDSPLTPCPICAPPAEPKP